MADPSKKLLIATHNQGKFRELSELLADVPFELVSLDDAGVEEDVDETGATLEENAVLKATMYEQLAGLPTLADDSGLEVDALNGEPGPRSARYAGEHATDAERVAFLLGKLESVPDESRTARFRCVIAISWPGEPVETYDGQCTGRIVHEPRGANGFGYDPVFLVDGFGRTMAELSAEEKNCVSHRSRAAEKAADALRRRAASA